MPYIFPFSWPFNCYNTEKEQQQKAKNFFWPNGKRPKKTPLG